MDSNQPYRIPGRRVALAMLLAAVVGAASPLLVVLELTLLLPVVAVGGVFMVFLYFYGGRLPAWLFLAVHLASAALVLDDTFMWLLLAAGSIPAMLCARGISSRQPFFNQLRASVALYAAGMLAALLIAWARFGGGIIGRAVDALLREFDRMPDAFFQPFVDAINAALKQGDFIGIRAMTVASYRDYITGILTLAKQTYEAALPGTLLSGAAVSGVISALWGSWLMARHGLATEESYVPIDRWFLPAGVTGGLTLVWLTTYILAQLGYAAGESAYEAAFNLINVAFYFQALGTIDRFFSRRGVDARGRRRRVVAAAIIGALFRYVGLGLFVIGGCSAFFGSHGAARGFQNRGHDGHNDD